MSETVYDPFELVTDLADKIGIHQLYAIARDICMSDLIDRQNEPRETVKAILENLDVIQNETKNELRMIADAIYRGTSVSGERIENEPRNEPITIQFARQRDTAKQILQALVEIREVLW